MVDRVLLAKQVATVRDATARIRAVLPPSSEAFEADGVIPRPLALRPVAAAGLRNLVAHQYGTLDWARLHATAPSPELDDLEAFCAALATKVR
jgi:hypothetical protein